MRTVDEPRDGPPDCSEGAGGRLEKNGPLQGAKRFQDSRFNFCITCIGVSG